MLRNLATLAFFLFSTSGCLFVGNATMNWANPSKPFTSVGVVTTPGPVTYDAVGSGTSGDPYILSTPAQLVDLQNSPAGWGSDFELQNDIVMEGPSNPIGTDLNPYTGTFDGAGHLISNLSFPDGLSATGLFGQSNGTILNISVQGNINTPGSGQTGMVAGINYGLIQNCRVSGSVLGGHNVGAIVGLDPGGTIENCAAFADVTGSGGSIGGLVGELGNILQNSMFSGTVTAAPSSYDIGGAVGYAWGNSILIQNVYTAGSIVGDTACDSIGGIMGVWEGSSINAQILYSFSTMAIQGGTHTDFTIGDDLGVSLTQVLYWSGATCTASGSCTATGTPESTLSYFYSQASLPYSAWSTLDWSWSGTGLPSLN